MKPIPSPHPPGVTVFKQNPELSAAGYQEEQIGIYWNYYFTLPNWHWPEQLEHSSQYIIDGFAPNLNKELHIGHLRNLAVAKSLSQILRPNVRMVAMLGAAVGVLPDAEAKLQEWFGFVDYRPEIYFDNQLKEPTCQLLDGEGDQLGCKVWQGGPLGPVIVTRADGRHTYAFHDLSFAEHVGPTHYITGAEQHEHFKSLGLGDKHLPMGLVLGSEGKKISSRTGEALSAGEVLQKLMEALKETPEPKKLAWNILVWNFLRSNRSKNIIFDPVQWTRTEAPGMYISYTYARIGSALKGLDGDQNQIMEDDLKLLGLASYKDYYLQRAREILDSSPLANYALSLTEVMNFIYHTERINDGRPGLQFAMRHAHTVLGQCFDLLGMHRLQVV